MELDYGTYYGRSHFETSRTEEPKKHNKENPVPSYLWSLFQLSGIQHGGNMPGDMPVCQHPQGPGGAFVLQNEVSGKTSW